MSFDRSALTTQFLATKALKFPEGVKALICSASIPYNKLTNLSGEDLIEGVFAQADVTLSKDNRHVVLHVPQLSDDAEAHSIVIGLFGDDPTKGEYIAVAVQSHKDLTDHYVAFEIKEDNGFIHLEAEENSRALYEDLVKISEQGIKGLNLAYDPESQDIILTDGNGTILDSANIVPQVSGVDPSGIVYTEGKQIIKDQKLWTDEEPEAPEQETPNLSDYVKTDTNGEDTPKHLTSEMLASVSSGGDASVMVIDPTGDPIDVNVSEDNDNTGSTYTFYYKERTVRVHVDDDDVVTVNDNDDNEYTDETIIQEAKVIAVAAARKLYLDKYNEVRKSQLTNFKPTTYASVDKSGFEVQKPDDDDDTYTYTTKVTGDGLKATYDTNDGDVRTLEVRNENRGPAIEAVGGEGLYINAKEDEDTFGDIFLQEAIAVDNSGYIAGAPVASIRGMYANGSFKLNTTNGFVATVADGKVTLTVDTKVSHMSSCKEGNMAMAEVVGFGNVCEADGVMQPITVAQTLRCCGIWSDERSITIDLTMVEAWFRSLDEDEHGMFVINVFDFAEDSAV